MEEKEEDAEEELGRRRGNKVRKRERKKRKRSKWKRKRGRGGGGWGGGGRGGGGRGEQCLAPASPFSAWSTAQHFKGEVASLWGELGRPLARGSLHRAKCEGNSGVLAKAQEPTSSLKLHLGVNLELPE